MNKNITHEKAFNLTHWRNILLRYLVIYCIFQKFANILIIFKRRVLRSICILHPVAFFVKNSHEFCKSFWQILTCLSLQLFLFCKKGHWGSYLYYDWQLAFLLKCPTMWWRQGSLLDILIFDFTNHKKMDVVLKWRKNCFSW